ncbi:MAG TPA: ZIP family metal transporter [Candidatus Omnitrophota bacterium]|nr:ZIP family metal transporter [Candidatus Omnitrophota bacterium]
MAEFLQACHPVVAALWAGIFTWGMTALGAAMVLFTYHVNERLLASMLGFSAGVMIAASFWSLLDPAIKMASGTALPSWFPAVTGFLLGCGFLSLADRFLPHVHLDRPVEKAEGIRTNWKRTTLLVFAITLHNIPEGLAVGVAMGAAASHLGSTSMAAAIALAVGIGIQNFPEGLAVSMPLRASGFSRRKSFMVGQWSGIVEPLAAMIGAAAVFLVKPLLPYALSFAAGAMIFVVIEELIPESQNGDHGDIATLGFVVGFTVMMLLDVALG